MMAVVFWKVRLRKLDPRKCGSWTPNGLHIELAPLLPQRLAGLVAGGGGHRR